AFDLSQERINSFSAFRFLYERLLGAAARPYLPAAFCAAMARSLGVAVAVVDVNDLGRVKVLASSPGCDEALLERALRPNPAGNANERTPLVLVRPS
ncbi:MAG: hypothetical protein NWP84_03770, partial [Cyanobium sp. MAG_04]|nr:hypothetical protein [Cyanobium sp. MAG_04]